MRDSRETEFVREVQGWERGLFRGSFSTPQELTVAAPGATRLELANAVGPVNKLEVKERALALLPEERRGYASGNAALSVALAGAPLQSILRPIEIENPTLAEALHQAALFGDRRIFDHSLGVQRNRRRSLVLTQERSLPLLLVNEQGSILITLPVRQGNRMLPELLHEFVQEQISAALGYATWVLELIDPTQRLTHVAVAVSISRCRPHGVADPARKRGESEPDKHECRVGSGEHAPVEVSRTRAALRLDTARIVEDLLVPLRRQWR